jgi:hypothetical protein
LVILLGAIFFGSLVYVAIAVGEKASPPNDRFGSIGSEGLRILLCASAAIIGGLLFAHGAPPETLFAIAILCAALGATCFLTTFDTPVPLVVPAAPLAILVGAALLNRDVGPLLSALVTGAPLAVTAVFLHQTKADLRDTCVAALGGAVFGMQLGIFVVGAACLAFSLARPYIARHRTRPQPPARFASALAAAFMLLLVGQLAIS